MEVTLPQDAGPPPHTHRWDEAYFVTEGDVEFRVGDQRFTATAAISSTRRGAWCTAFAARHGGRRVC